MSQVGNSHVNEIELDYQNHFFKRIYSNIHYTEFLVFQFLDYLQSKYLGQNYLGVILS